LQPNLYSIMKTKTLLFLLLINVSGLFAQNTNRFDTRFENANAQYIAGNFFEALPMYLELYRSDSSNANISYLVGDCYLRARSGKANAIRYLEKATMSISPDYKKNYSEEKNAPILAYKLLGDAYHIHSEFDKAIQSYETYKSKLISYKRKDNLNLKDANRKIEMCNTAKELIATPVNVKIENMGKALNSPYGDYSPVLTGDQSTMIFTSRRKESTGGQTYDGGRYYEDIYISNYTGTEWTVAQNIGTPINTDGNEATVGISPDGQEILIYKDDNGDGNIYSTTLNGDVWSTPLKLNSNINSKSWEPSAFISADGHTIYFSSDRPGGFGGRDIYVSQKTEKGDWGKAVNMGPLINTPYDEDAPFIHPDGITLFFSSNGHNTMGGFDVFYSSLSEDETTWLTPVNVGYPINSPDDDIFYVVSTDKTKAYYSSFKEGGIGEKDNYVITFIDQKKAPLTLLKGIVKEADGSVPKDVVITVTDNESGKIVGIYNANSKTGQYLFILTPGKNYNISYEAEGFLFYSENRQIEKKTNYYEIYKAIQLPPITIGSKVVLNNIFFDFDKATLRKTSNVELRNILRFLNKYPKLKIEIAGYTDSKGTDAYNLKLSEDRALAVVTYLTGKGINKERMVSKGYGETSPDAKNQNYDGTDNPEGRQLNRRVEMKIIGIK
jgi:outer membrane protein OmpA-like peptidoglycan-associated protein